MKKNQGFTLIELLAVIIILGVIGLIVFPSVLDSISDSKEKLYVEQVDRIITEAESWASTHDSKLPDSKENSTPIKISVELLKKAGLLKNDAIKNPLNSSEVMTSPIVIYYDFEYNQYLTVYCDLEYGDKYYKNSSDYENVKNICNRTDLIEVTSNI